VGSETVDIGFLIECYDYFGAVVEPGFSDSQINDWEVIGE
jgi:hypothetical protein